MELRRRPKPIQRSSSNNNTNKNDIENASCPSLGRKRTDNNEEQYMPYHHGRRHRHPNQLFHRLMRGADQISTCMIIISVFIFAAHMLVVAFNNESCVENECHSQQNFSSSSWGGNRQEQEQRGRPDRIQGVSLSNDHDDETRHPIYVKIMSLNGMYDPFPLPTDPIIEQNDDENNDNDVESDSEADGETEDDETETEDNEIEDNETEDNETEDNEIEDDETEDNETEDNEKNNGDSTKTKGPADFGDFMATPLTKYEAQQQTKKLKQQFHKEDFEGHVYTKEDYSTDDYASTETEYMIQYLADDDAVMHPTCRKTDVHGKRTPTCNTFHEVDLVDKDGTEKSRYLASGCYRDAFAVLNEESVVKVTRLEQPYNYDMESMMNVDATVMELMGNSERFVNIHGHCGFSVAVDFLKGIDIEGLLINATRAELENPPDLLTPTQKLNLALEMAKPLAELHGLKSGVIVHNDVQYSQYLFRPDGSVILSDFNRAEPLLWDEENQKFCKYGATGGNGNVRSPEEYANQSLDEKVDVYSFGNIIYTILIGDEPYAEQAERGGYYHIKGIVPKVPDTIKSNSFAESALVAVMDKCFEYFAEKRIDMQKVVSLLEDAVSFNEKLEEIKISPTNPELHETNVTLYPYDDDDGYDEEDYYETEDAHVEIIAEEEEDGDNPDGDISESESEDGDGDDGNYNEEEYEDDLI